MSPFPRSPRTPDELRALEPVTAREVEAIVRALREQGPLTPRALRAATESRFWGPGRFRAAVRQARREGRVVRSGRRGLAAAGQPPGSPSPGDR
jgi:hypothetical protein